MPVIALLRHARQETASSLSVFARDIGRGLLEIGHNTLALVGLAAVAVGVFAVGQADLRDRVEAVALDWLQARQEERDGASGSVPEDEPAAPEGVARATAADLKQLTRQQATLSTWIARRYQVAPEPIAALVQEAWAIGQRAKLDPTLILAIMAIESRFNPFAQSALGAQGLMQVMTKVHDDKYIAFGGTHAAFDPISNLRVGVQVLKECIVRAGGMQEGLRHYVGAALLEGDGGYVSRVLAEQANMRNVADGKRVPVRMAPALPALGAGTATGGGAVTRPPVQEPAADAVPVARAAPLTQQIALLR